MTTLTDFITARLAEDEKTARAAIYDRYNTTEEWHCGEGKGGIRTWWVADGWGDGIVQTTETAYPAEMATHIARFDPKRVLREVEAKRAILARHCPDRPPYVEYCRECENTRLNECPELRDLAAIWSDDPDYREEWRP